MSFFKCAPTLSNSATCPCPQAVPWSSTKTTKIKTKIKKPTTKPLLATITSPIKVLPWTLSVHEFKPSTANSQENHFLHDSNKCNANDDVSSSCQDMFLLLFYLHCLQTSRVCQNMFWTYVKTFKIIESAWYLIRTENTHKRNFKRFSLLWAVAINIKNF